MTDNIDRLVEASAQTRVHDEYTRSGVGVPSLSIFPFFRPKSDLDIPRWGYAGRDSLLGRVWHIAGADIVASAIAVTIQKVQSTGYTITGPDRTVSGRARPIIEYAEFGKGWLHFLARWINAFCTFDNGVFTEYLADAPPQRTLGQIRRYQDGDPVRDLMKPREGPVIGISVLDSTRCERTGDFEYPVRYYDLEGRAHLYHRTRIHVTADMPAVQEWLFDYGFCALSRCLATLNYGVNWATARNEMLDNMPPLSILTASGINKAQLEQQMMESQQQREAVGEYVLRTVLWLVNPSADKEVKIGQTPIRQLWESFDEKQALDVSVTMVAMAFGLDYQDLAPLATAAMGSGAQSTVLDKKAIGKGPGNIMAHLEALLRDIFPASCEFKFDFQDDQQDLQKAQIQQTKAATIMSLVQPLSAPQSNGLGMGQSPFGASSNGLDSQQSVYEGLQAQSGLSNGANGLSSAPPTNGNGKPAESLLSRDEARLILMAELPEWADIIDPERNIRDEVTVDELSPDLQAAQTKMFGPRVRYNSKTRKTISLVKARKPFLPVPAISEHEIADAIHDLTEMGIDLASLRNRQYKDFDPSQAQIATDTTKGLETPEQRRWYFANHPEHSDSGNGALDRGMNRAVQIGKPYTLEMPSWGKDPAYFREVTLTHASPATLDIMREYGATYSPDPSNPAVHRFTFRGGRSSYGFRPRNIEQILHLSGHRYNEEVWPYSTPEEIRELYGSHKPRKGKASDG